MAACSTSFRTIVRASLRSISRRFARDSEDQRMEGKEPSSLESSAKIRETGYVIKSYQIDRFYERKEK